MLRPKTMSHLLIAASREQMEPIIRELYSHNIFHIQVFTEQEGKEHEGLTIGTPLAGAGEASTRLIQIRSLESTFGVDREMVDPSQRRPAAALRTSIDRTLPDVWQKVEDLLSRRTACDAAQKEHEQQIRELKPFAAAPIGLELYRGYEGITVFAGRISRDVNIPVPHEKYFSASKEANFIAVFTPVEHKADVERLLLDAHYVALPIPKGEGMPKDRIEEHTKAIASIQKEIASTDEKIGAVKKEHTEFLAACEELLTADVEQAEAPLRFATTSQAFIAEGWVPASEVERVKSGISLAAGGKVLVTELEEKGEHHQPAPVEYDNPTFAQPTQLIVDTYSRPRYDETDPTLLISIIFPLFFGIILGDVGYGLMLLALALGIRYVIRVTGAMRPLFVVLRNAAVSSIIFGVLYSEFFGFSMGYAPILFSRHLNIGAHAAAGHGPDIAALLIFAVWIGILQMTLGRAINVANHHRHHEMIGVMAQIGWIAAMWGILVLLWSMFALPYMPDLTALPPIVAGINLAGLVGAVMLVFGLIAIVRESPLEIVEIPTIISHGMSYTRLAAVGLSSVAIAMVVNLIAIEMLIEPALHEITPLGIVLILVGVVVLLVGHLLNAALGLLGGGLQSLRLQYVEFFTKFYKGGGEKYNPFGMKKRFTED